MISREVACVTNPSAFDYLVNDHGQKTTSKDIACRQSLTVPGSALVPKNLIQGLLGEDPRRLSHINPPERILMMEKHVVPSSLYWQT
jgi:hypothetical protein